MAVARSSSATTPQECRWSPQTDPHSPPCCKCGTLLQLARLPLPPSTCMCQRRWCPSRGVAGAAALAPKVPHPAPSVPAALPPREPLPGAGAFCAYLAPSGRATGRQQPTPGTAGRGVALRCGFGGGDAPCETPALPTWRLPVERQGDNRITLAMPEGRVALWAAAAAATRRRSDPLRRARSLGYRRVGAARAPSVCARLCLLGAFGSLVGVVVWKPSGCVVLQPFCISRAVGVCGWPQAILWS